VILKDHACNTRLSLTNTLKAKVTGDTRPIKLAPNKEILESKGGYCSTEKFRGGQEITSINHSMQMPPMILLPHPANVCR
jgi:hypothetical protein